MSPTNKNKSVEANIESILHPGPEEMRARYARFDEIKKRIREEDAEAVRRNDLLREFVKEFGKQDPA